MESVNQGALVQAHPEALVSEETLGRLDIFQWKCIFSVDTKICHRENRNSYL